MVALFVFMILPRDEIHVVFNTSIFPQIGISE